MLLVGTIFTPSVVELAADLSGRVGIVVTVLAFNMLAESVRDSFATRLIHD